MNILILAAMDKELSLLLSIMPEYKEINSDKLKYYQGVVGKHNVTVSKCGIGKVNSAVNTLRLIQNLSPDLVINSGVAGGVDGKIEIGTVLVADSIIYHDVWCGPGTVIGLADGFKERFYPDTNVVNLSKELFASRDDVVYGLICSGDRFIHEEKEVDEIKEKFNDAVAVDMESASIAQVCAMENVPVAVLRVMSDTPGKGNNVSQYEDFWNKAPQKTFECLVELLKALN